MSWNRVFCFFNFYATSSVGKPVQYGCGCNTVLYLFIRFYEEQMTEQQETQRMITYEHFFNHLASNDIYIYTHTHTHTHTHMYAVPHS